MKIYMARTVITTIAFSRIGMLEYLTPSLSPCIHDPWGILMRALDEAVRGLKKPSCFMQWMGATRVYALRHVPPPPSFPLSDHTVVVLCHKRQGEENVHCSIDWLITQCPYQSPAAIFALGYHSLL